MLVPALVHADVLVLNDETRLEGRTEPSLSDVNRIAFISGSGRMELPLTRVKEHIEEPDALDWTRVAGQYINSKNYGLAIQYFQRALEADSTFDEARQGLKSAQDALAAQQGERERQTAESVSAQLEKVPGMIKAEAYEDAKKLLEQVLASKATSDQELMARRQMRDLYLAWGFSRFDRLDYSGAEERYLRVLEMDPENAEARDKLLAIWQHDPAKKGEVLKAYQAKLREEPENLEYNRIVANGLYDSQEYEAAIAPLQKVYSAPRYAHQGYDDKLLKSYRQTIQDQESGENLDQAIATFEQMLSIFPNEDTTALTVLKYKRDRRQIADTDYTGWALLVKRVYDQGLTEFAVREAEVVLRYDPTNETALSIIRAEAVSRMTRMDALMAESQYIVVRDMSLQYMKDEVRFTDLVQKAQELYNRADIEARRDEKSNKEKARDIAQRGLEYYNQAMQNVSLLTSRDTRRDARPVNYKSQAIDFADRAIAHYKTAIRMDPSLAGIEGMDLQSRLRDAENLVSGLTDRPSPIPRIRNKS